MCARLKVPFNYSKKEQFPSELANWIGDVFYEILPEKGYEVREEQIFTAFQIAEAVCKNKVHLGEAGLGTGKTFAYLLTAVSYARLTQKPVVIACASTALQEQLAGPKGDIAILSILLDLDIDARMAKDPRHFVCDLRMENFANNPGQDSVEDFDQVLNWYENTTRGERSEVPHISDRIWEQIAWKEDMACEMCSQRGYCKLVKAREHYRSAADLVVTDHEVFFKDLWIREELLADGKLPLLPRYSAVVFDEGHKIMLPAAMTAGRKIVREDLEEIIFSLEKIQGARTSLISAAVAMDLASSKFFEILQKAVIADEGTDRLPVRVNNTLRTAADKLYRALQNLEFQLQNEQELYFQSLPMAKFDAFDLKIERTMAALRRLSKFSTKDTIIWAERMDNTLWVVPRDLNGMLNKHLFSKEIPVIFSSATLSTGGDFSYIKRNLGLKDPTMSTVESPFDYDEQAVIYLPSHLPESKDGTWFTLAIKEIVSLLNSNRGRALILTNSTLEARKIANQLAKYPFPFEILREDMGDRGFLIQRFKDEVSSVLIGSGFWEGIDVPGEALSLVIIWRLPFPTGDPLIEARRNDAQEMGFDPLLAVDYPEMALRLKQGCGRLIRGKDDRGIIAILEPIKGFPWEQVVLGSLPSGAKIVNNLAKAGLTDYKNVT